jgi:hypothetical protein
MRTFDPEDRVQNHLRVLEVYGSSYKFNYCLSISTKDAVKAIRDLPEEFNASPMMNLFCCRPNKDWAELKANCCLLQRACISLSRETDLCVSN